MPIYEYSCPECGIFEQMQRISEAAFKVCPHCAEKGKKVKVEKILSPVGFQFVGSGWYINDYSNGKGKEATQGESSPPSAPPSAGGNESKSEESKPCSSEESSSSEPSTSKDACGNSCACQ